jgi:uncharacterized membrane protein YphA (DoxX/SURF4 family)
MTVHNTEARMRFALTGLQWCLGIVILIEATLFLFQSGSRHQFGSTHMPSTIRLILGWGELIGALLLLIPQTAVRGAWLLLLTFMLAIVIHLMHGMPNIGSLVIYSAAAWAVAWGKA